MLGNRPERDSGQVDEFGEILESEDPWRMSLRVHPAVPKSVRTARPQDLLPRAGGPISQIREADGLEAVLRLAALWQRLGAEPLRQTQQGVLYKRDRDRIDLDPVLASPIADSFVPLPDSPSLWLALARRVGLIELEAGGERLLAAPLEFWTENEFHLPQMIATGWLSLPDWCELPPEAPAEDECGGRRVRISSVRAVLLWLSTLGDSEWVALDDLAAQLDRAMPGMEPPVQEPRRSGRFISPRQTSSRAPCPFTQHGRLSAARTVLLESILLGAAYPLGCPRRRGSTHRAASRATEHAGPIRPGGGPDTTAPPCVRAIFVCATQFRSDRLSPGIDPANGGPPEPVRLVDPDRLGPRAQALARVDRSRPGPRLKTRVDARNAHLASQRPLSRGVIEAINHWAERRERVVFYNATTLIEFASQVERDQAIELWPAGEDAPPVPVAERFLLVEDDRSVPYARLRLTSSRDYRRPPEVCVTVEADGVTLVLDPARADLLVDAELAQFADPVPVPERSSGHPVNVVAAPVLDHGRVACKGESAAAWSPPWLSEWFKRRAGRAIPAAVELCCLRNRPACRGSKPPRSSF